MNIQGDRKLRGLSEYGIILLKMCFYSNDILEILIPAFAFQGYIYLLLGSKITVEPVLVLLLFKVLNNGIFFMKVFTWVPSHRRVLRCHA